MRGAWWICAYAVGAKHTCSCQILLRAISFMSLAFQFMVTDVEHLQGGEMGGRRPWDLDRRGCVEDRTELATFFTYFQSSTQPEGQSSTQPQGAGPDPPLPS